MFSSSSNNMDIPVNIIDDKIGSEDIEMAMEEVDIE